MSTQIVAKIKTASQMFDFEMPYPTENLVERLNQAGVTVGDRNNYSIEDIYCIQAFLNDYIKSSQDIRELNTLANLVDKFDNKDMENYEGLLEANSELEEVNIRKAIDVAFNLHKYNIEPCINDCEELGTHYVDSKELGLEEKIYASIDFVGIGETVKNEQNGEFTNVGYVSNFYENFDTEPTVGQDDEPSPYLETINGLIKAAVGIAEIGGESMMAEIDTIRNSLSSIVNFWNLGNQHIDQFDIEVGEGMEQHDDEMQLGGM